MKNEFIFIEKDNTVKDYQGKYFVLMKEEEGAIILFNGVEEKFARQIKERIDKAIYLHYDLDCT